MVERIEYIRRIQTTVTTPINSKLVMVKVMYWVKTARPSGMEANDTDFGHNHYASENAACSEGTLNMLSSSVNYEVEGITVIR